ncbi:hypothetical protein VFPPC_17958 [Pochonia chlamydosporia 170]|uniref:Uncharacterized protein n=1 Tax=Pochonia chlamydosporia 170 TaxID=1380566 RepID=A0A219AQF1_METCM|nr:hypothetical protein VFPPC_17958 [Pochonia chlamydosporia 170]OWT42849.1 hypothetical protein VFPPC_17958 [Pochonia chlamydosporia 170]
MDTLAQGGKMGILFPISVIPASWIHYVTCRAVTMWRATSEPGTQLVPCFPCLHPRHACFLVMKLHQRSPSPGDSLTGIPIPEVEYFRA